MTTQVPPDVTVLCLKSVFSVRYWHTMLCIVDTIMTFCTLCKVIYRCRIDAIVALPPYGAFYSIMTHNVLPLFRTLYNSDTTICLCSVIWWHTLSVLCILYSIQYTCRLYNVDTTHFVCTLYTIQWWHTTLCLYSIHYTMVTHHTLSVLYTLYNGDPPHFVCTLYTIQRWFTTLSLYSVHCTIVTHHTLSILCTLYNDDTPQFVCNLCTIDGDSRHFVCTPYTIQRWNNTLCLHSIQCTMVTHHTLSALYTLYTGDTPHFVCTLYNVQW